MERHFKKYGWNTTLIESTILTLFASHCLSCHHCHLQHHFGHSVDKTLCSIATKPLAAAVRYYEKPLIIIIMIIMITRFDNHLLCSNNVTKSPTLDGQNADEDDHRYQYDHYPHWYHHHCLLIEQPIQICIHIQSNHIFLAVMTLQRMGRVLILWTSHPLSMIIILIIKIIITIIIEFFLSYID